MSLELELSHVVVTAVFVVVKIAAAGKSGEVSRHNRGRFEREIES